MENIIIARQSSIQRTIEYFWVRRSEHEAKTRLVGLDLKTLLCYGIIIFNSTNIDENVVFRITIW